MKPQNIRSIPGEMCEYCHLHRISITVEKKILGREKWWISCPCGRHEDAIASSHDKAMKKWRE